MVGRFTLRSSTIFSTTGGAVVYIKHRQDASIAYHRRIVLLLVSPYSAAWNAPIDCKHLIRFTENGFLGCWFASEYTSPLLFLLVKRNAARRDLQWL